MLKACQKTRAVHEATSWVPSAKGPRPSAVQGRQVCTPASNDGLQGLQWGEGIATPLPREQPFPALTGGRGGQAGPRALECVRASWPQSMRVQREALGQPWRIGKSGLQLLARDKFAKPSYKEGGKFNFQISFLRSMRLNFAAEPRGAPKSQCSSFKGSP